MTVEKGGKKPFLVSPIAFAIAPTCGDWTNNIEHVHTANLPLPVRRFSVSPVHATVAFQKFQLLVKLSVPSPICTEPSIASHAFSSAVKTKQQT